MLPVRWLAMFRAAECVSGRGCPAAVVDVAVWGVCSALRAEFWVGVPADGRPLAAAAEARAVLSGAGRLG